METNQSAEVQYSLFEASPFHKALARVGLDKHPVKLAIICVCVAWLPLLILTAIEGTLYAGTSLTFFNDIALHTRMLLALPLLILIRAVIDQKVVSVLRYIIESLIRPEDKERIISGTLRKSKRLASSPLTEIVLILIICASLFSVWQSGLFTETERGAASWMVTESMEITKLSLAGNWAVFVSFPFFQFLLLRWIWRYFIWLYLVFRISQAPLTLMPTHADRSGGVGIMILAQRSFNMVFLACAIVISGQFVARILEDPASFNSIRSVVIGFIILCVLLIIMPLAFFMGKLIKTKQQGLIHMSQLGAELSHKFEQDWMNDMPIEKRIEQRQVDPSMAYDYSSMYDVLQQLRIIPITLRDIIGMVAMLFVPFIPLLFIHYSALELLQKILGLLM